VPCPKRAHKGAPYISVVLGAKLESPSQLDGMKNRAVHQLVARLSRMSRSEGSAFVAWVARTSVFEARGLPINPGTNTSFLEVGGSYLAMPGNAVTGQEPQTAKAAVCATPGHAAGNRTDGAKFVLWVAQRSCFSNSALRLRSGP
jgi:hypothetical protein